MIVGEQCDSREDKVNEGVRPSCADCSQIVQPRRIACHVLTIVRHPYAHYHAAASKFLLAISRQSQVYPTFFYDKQTATSALRV